MTSRLTLIKNDGTQDVLTVGGSTITLAGETNEGCLIDLRKVRLVIILTNPEQDEP